MIYRVNTMVVWLTIAQGTDFFREGLEHGYFVMRKDRKGSRQLDFWQPGMALVDFTNPAATKWYTDKLRTLLDMGVDCFKTDFGERFPKGIRQVTDYIRSKGMTPGIWLELEVIGVHSPKLAELSDDCFFKRHGRRIYDRSRY